MLKLKDHMVAGLCLAAVTMLPGYSLAAEDPTEFVVGQIAKMNVGPQDWPQWGGSTSRNNTPDRKLMTTAAIRTGMVGLLFRCQARACFHECRPPAVLL